MRHESYSILSSRRPLCAIATMKPRRRVPERRFAIVRETLPERGCRAGLRIFRTELKFEGNRAIVFDESDAVPTDALAVCIAAALTYHRDKAAALRR
jgi:hypothetical protein